MDSIDFGNRWWGLCIHAMDHGAVTKKDKEIRHEIRKWFVIPVSLLIAVAIHATLAQIRTDKSIERITKRQAELEWLRTAPVITEGTGVHIGSGKDYIDVALEGIKSRDCPSVVGTLEGYVRAGDGGWRPVDQVDSIKERRVSGKQFKERRVPAMGTKQSFGRWRLIGLDFPTSRITEGMATVEHLCSSEVEQSDGSVRIESFRIQSTWGPFPVNAVLPGS